MSYETAIFHWEDGERRLRTAAPERRRPLERVTAAVTDELRRRLGGRFTRAELADLYDQGTDWGLEVAMVVAPDDPWAWNSEIVVDAAFARYAREAADFGGGL